MIRARLARLERRVRAVSANCLGCFQIPGVVWMPGEPEPSNPPVRCARCGKKHLPTVIRIVVPALPKNLITRD
jgi:hypothetical protein